MTSWVKNSTLAFFFLCGMWVLPLAAQDPGLGSAKPNIIFLMTDDQRWDTLGCMGNDLIQTPNIDRMARQGVVFDNMFVTTSICATNRASVLTGQYARRHGVWDFRTQLSAQQLAQTYAGQLSEAGYRIGFIGKYGIANPPRDFFDFDRAWPGQGQYFVRVRPTDPIQFGFSPDAEGEKRHLTCVLGDQILEFLERTPADRPFRLSVSFKSAHVQDSYNLSDRPFQPDPSLETMYQDVDIPRPVTANDESFQHQPEFLQNSEARMRWAVRFWGPDRYQDCVKDYYRLISGVDRQVGRVMETLRRKGLADNTILIFTGDNGFFLGEHGFAGKWFPHEESIRVPLVMLDPRLPSQRRGARVAQSVLSIDIAPTICALAGVTPPEGMQGASVAPLARGDSVAWRSDWLYEHLFEHPRIPMNEAVRTDRWKYMRFQVEPVWEGLFDLQNDPGETKNLAAEDQYGELMTKLRGRLESLRLEAE